ncbi:Hypothetical predicted protein [Lecanosticta acicola]|uniref:Uncharacterized protein n=1 Tax=Lecanosticta acicola TaxID=111012 RepID=A0AAI9E900_9PEZI|nr:Hypothetical predicted protein [Lecanosticta acicola]
MPRDLFKWEDQGGLKHHCPICQTPLSHDKCRTICLGNHVEWCHRYHCLFRKNWSSRCSACKMTDEQHEKRHREIAEVLAKVKKFKAEEDAALLELLRSPDTPKTPRTPLTAKALNTVAGPDGTGSYEVPKTTKKVRKAAKKAVRAMERDKVVTTADIQFIAQILHPKGDKEEVEVDMEELEEDLEIKMNLKFNNSTCNTKSVRHDYITKDRESKEVDSTEIERILASLEVDPKAAGKEGELVVELVQAIKNDLVHYHDELKIIARNKAGFWRWANKRVYRDRVENGKEWDAKHDRDPEQNQGQEERRNSELSVEMETEDETSTRNGSIDLSIPESAGTAITVPSTKAASSRKAPPVPKLDTPLKETSSTLFAKTPSTNKTPVLETDTPTKGASSEDPGWTRVGEKVMKPPVGKLTLASNGGLHHLESKPKANFWALSKLE